MKGQTSTKLEEKRMTKNCKEVNRKGENGYWKNINGAYTYLLRKK